MAMDIRRLLLTLCLLPAALAPVAAQRPEAAVRQEIAQAAKEAPQLAEVLALGPGTTAADIGAGGGAMSVALAKFLGPTGRVYATDIGAAQLAEILEYVAREGVSNVAVIEGTPNSTNLPEGCCDAIFLRDVYHHLTSAEQMNKSVFAALKQGGRLAVIDFEPQAGSALPKGVPENRGGHGIRPGLLISEITAAGLRHVTTIPRWPPDGRNPIYLALFQKP
jgi:predicted methyltransferase